MEAGATDRGGGFEPSVAMDLYQAICERAYGNLLVATAPGAERIARTTVLAEMYGSVAGPWEASAGVRHLRFADTAITLGTASVARYAGSWIPRARATVSTKGSVAVSGAASVRYLLDEQGGPFAPFIEGTLGQGQEPVVDANGITTIRRSWIGAARAQHAIGRRAAISLGAGYTEDGTLSRWSANGGLIVGL